MSRSDRSTRFIQLKKYRHGGLHSRPTLPIDKANEPTEDHVANTSDGRFVWYELMTTDSKAAVAFYTGVVGWKTQPFDAEHDYLMWVSGQGPLGGTMTLPEKSNATGTYPHWTSHVHVSDVDATVGSVRKLGGRVLVEPQDIPSVGALPSSPIPRAQ